MFSKHTAEAPASKIESFNDSKVGLQYFKVGKHESRKIPICMDTPVSLKQHSGTELSAISVLMNRGIKKTLATPLRLYIEDDPPALSPKSDQVPSLFVNLDLEENSLEDRHLAQELPNELSTSPTIPPPPVEHDVQSPALTSTYSYNRSTFMTAPSRISTSVSIAHLTENSNKEFTEETWGAIFHPQSTFKHNEGELEYHAWSSVNLPVAAARVAQRVMQIQPECSSLPDQVEATLPVILPSPPLKPSPVLTIPSEPEFCAATEPYYFDMLKQIRGEHGCSVETTTTQTRLNASRLAKKYLLPAISTQKEEQYSIEDGATPMTAQAAMIEPEVVYDTSRYWTEKKLFWMGFVCPLLWFYGSYCIRASTANHSIDVLWQRRCRIASLYFSAIAAVVVLVTAVKAAGSAGARQAQSDAIRAVIAD
ncbi:hypothetical protein MFLAVUS_004403 [Mucor flavus]|uniref:Uncharacterized protein n=1 Tax=Mucor flavus TaxID=439312 RepID=A0ABP9YVT7_9FUNG